MKRAVLLVFCLIPTMAWSSTPPTLPHPLPPLKIPAAPHLMLGRPHGIGPEFLTREQIESFTMSSTMKIDILAHMPGAVKASATATPSTFDFAAAARQQTMRRAIRPLATPYGTSQAVNDAAQDIEPAIITGSFSGSNRTTTVFTKFLPGTVPRHYWTTTTDFVNFGGAPTGWEMPLPPGTTRSSDPLLSENPFSGAPFPNRTYCSGIAYALGGGSDGTATGYSALTVWYSDYPAAENAWTPMVIDAETYPVFFDKPSIATSWNAATRGYTYVATVVRHYDTPDSYSADIQVYRQGSTLGFTRVNQMLYLPAGTNSPIITVDSNTGDVYLLWIDTTYNAIQIARSTDMGNTFSSPISMPATAPLNGDGRICDTAVSNCTRAASVIMAKANPADNSIGVVWHLHETDNTHTDAGFNQFQLSTQAWRWWRGIQVGHPGANDGRDQWNPALDPASDGSYLMTWYDKRNDPLFANNGNSYQVFAVRTNADGTPIDAADTVIYNASAAANLTQLPAPPNQPYRFMGEYQDVWEWYGTWYGATTYLDANGQQDIYVMRIGQ